MNKKLFDYIMFRMNEIERSALLCKLAGWFEAVPDSEFWTAVEQLTLLERAADQEEHHD